MLAFDSDSQKVILAYRDGSDSFKGKARVGTISGTSISFGSESVYDSTGAIQFIMLFIMILPIKKFL